MPLTLRPSDQTRRLYGQHAYSVLFVDIALILSCITIFFCGIINIMQILRDDVTLLTHQGSEYRSSVLKCLATFLDTIPSSMTAFYALCSITCWTFFTLYPAVVLYANVALLAVWISTVILQIRGFDYFMAKNRYSLDWTTRPDADNWQGTYELVRHNTTTVPVFQRLMIIGGFIVLLLLTYQAIINASVLYGTASGIRLSTDYAQIEYPGESNQPQDEEVARKKPVPYDDEPAPASSRTNALASRIQGVRSFFSTRHRRSSRQHNMSDAAPTTALTRTDSTGDQSIWTSIRAVSSRISLFTLAPGTPYLPIHLSPRVSMEPPRYSSQVHLDLPIDQLDAPDGSGEETKAILPVQIEDEERSSSPSTEESLHFSDRVGRDDEVVLRGDDEAQEMRDSCYASNTEEDNAASAIDIDALIARITSEQEERFQARLAEQARRFGILLAQAMTGEDGSRAATEG